MVTPPVGVDEMTLRSDYRSDGYLGDRSACDKLALREKSYLSELSVR
jgi:hypothetical protein